MSPFRLVIVVLLIATPQLAHGQTLERFILNHTMEYEYDLPVLFSPHVVRLVPQPRSVATVKHDMLIKVAGSATQQRQADLENNLVNAVRFEGATKFLTVQNSIELVIPAKVAAVKHHPDERAGAIPFQYTANENKRLAPYLEIAKTGARFDKWFASVAPEADDSVKWLADLNKRICDEVKYFVRLDEGVLTVDDTLERGGSCRDFAWLLVQTLRKKGIAARFVSGYQIPGEVLANRDRKVYDGELHAWVEAYLPGCGWVSLDPTAGKWTTPAYLPVAATGWPADAGPLNGAFSLADPMPGVFAKSTLRFKITVQYLGPVKP